jgi:hypothetical protein
LSHGNKGIRRVEAREKDDPPKELNNEISE